jgi:hypothetical protein
MQLKVWSQAKLENTGKAEGSKPGHERTFLLLTRSTTIPIVRRLLTQVFQVHRANGSGNCSTRNARTDVGVGS